MIFGNIADDVMQSADIYFIFIAVSYPFLALYTSAAAIFRSMGNSKIPMNIVVLMNILNIGGNALFIYVFKWGVAGAAFSTLIGRIVVAVVLLRLLIKDKTRMSIYAAYQKENLTAE